MATRQQVVAGTQSDAFDDIWELVLGGCLLTDDNASCLQSGAT